MGTIEFRFFLAQSQNTIVLGTLTKFSGIISTKTNFMNEFLFWKFIVIYRVLLDFEAKSFTKFVIFSKRMLL